MHSWTQYVFMFMRERKKHTVTVVVTYENSWLLHYPIPCAVQMDCIHIYGKFSIFHLCVIMMASLKSRTENEVDTVSFNYNYDISLCIILESITYQCVAVLWIGYFEMFHNITWNAFDSWWDASMQMSNTRTGILCHKTRIQSIIMIVIIATTDHFW